MSSALLPGRPTPPPRLSPLPAASWGHAARDAAILPRAMKKTRASRASRSKIAACNDAACVVTPCRDVQVHPWRMQKWQTVVAALHEQCLASRPSGVAPRRSRLSLAASWGVAAHDVATSPRATPQCALRARSRLAAATPHYLEMFTNCSHSQPVQVSFAELCTQDLRPLGMGSPEVDDVSGLALSDFLLANTRMLLAGGQSSLFRALREVFRIASEGRLAFPCWPGRADAYCAPLPCRSAVAHALGQLGGAFPFAGQSLCMPSIGGVVLALFGRAGLEHAQSAESHCRHR